MKRNIFISILIALSISSCERRPGGGGDDVIPIYLRSYIMYYYNLEGVHIEEGYSSEEIPANISVFVHAGENTATYESTGEAKEAYDALCEKHGDMTFDRIIEFSHDLNMHRPSFPDVDFVSIEVRSDVDFDEEHTVGALLNDLIVANFDSPKSYIDSGYVESDFESDSPLDIMVKYSEITKNLDEIAPDDLPLLGSGHTYNDRDIGERVANVLILSFKKEPTMSKTHTFTVTMTADDGRVFKDTVEMTFE